MKKQTNNPTKRILAATLAALALPGLAVDLTIDTPTTVTTDISSPDKICNLFLNAPLTVSGSGRVVATNSIVFNDNSSVSVSEATFISDSKGMTYFRGAAPAGAPWITLSGNLWDKAFLYWMTVEDTATSTDDEIELIRLSGTWRAFPAMFELCNENAKPVVISFDGGSLSTVNSSGSSFHLPKAGAKTILRSINGKPIQFQFSTWEKKSVWNFPKNLAANVGTVETQGTGDVLFDGRQRSTYGGTASFNAPYTDPRLVWNHTGDFIFTNTIAKTTVDNALPYSESSPRTLRFGFIGSDVNALTNSSIDVNGHSSKVGNLFMGENTYVTNTASKAGRLVFGADGLASAFSGHVAKNVRIGKAAGTGTLTVGEASGGIWGTAESPLPGSDASRFYETADTVGSCWPGLLSDMALTAPQSVAIAGALELQAATGETNAAANLSFTGPGTLRKTGGGVTRVAGAAALPARLDVAEGTLAVCGRGNADKYWRFSFDYSNRSDNSGRIGKLGLFDNDGNWVAQGLSFAGQGLSASELSAGTFTFSADLKYQTTGNNFLKSPQAIFSAEYGKYGLNVTNMVAYKIDHGNVFTLTARLADDANPVCWFSSYRQHDQPSEMITVESSSDGVSWRKVSELDENGSNNGTYYTWLNDRSFGSLKVTIDGKEKTLYCGLPFPVEDSGDALSSATSAVAAKVASGATLDLSAAPGVTVSSIDVDWANLGGTILGGTVAANGTLNISNVPAGTDVIGTTLFTLADSASANNLKSWTVMVNGAAKAAPIQIAANGDVSLSSAATVLYVR